MRMMLGGTMIVVVAAACGGRGMPMSARGCPLPAKERPEGLACEVRIVVNQGETQLRGYDGRRRLRWLTIREGDAERFVRPVYDGDRVTEQIEWEVRRTQMRIVENERNGQSMMYPGEPTRYVRLRAAFGYDGKGRRLERRVHEQTWLDRDDIAGIAPAARGCSSSGPALRDYVRWTYGADGRTASLTLSATIVVPAAAERHRIEDGDSYFFGYDELGNLTRIDAQARAAPRSESESYRRLEDGNVSVEHDQRRYYLWVFDAERRLTEERAGDVALTSFAYDAQGRLLRVEGPAPRSFTYDAKGRVTGCEGGPDGPVTITYSDACPSDIAADLLPRPDPYLRTILNFLPSIDPAAHPSLPTTSWCR